MTKLGILRNLLPLSQMMHASHARCAKLSSTCSLSDTSHPALPYRPYASCLSCTPLPWMHRPPEPLALPACFDIKWRENATNVARGHGSIRILRHFSHSSSSIIVLELTAPRSFCKSVLTFSITLVPQHRHDDDRRPLASSFLNLISLCIVPKLRHTNIRNHREMTSFQCRSQSAATDQCSGC